MIYDSLLFKLVCFGDTPVRLVLDIMFSIVDSKSVVCEIEKKGRVIKKKKL